jgi:hypothetical protein
MTRAGGIVPWTAQATNTDPSNFLWSTDKIYVEVISPGLYRPPNPFTPPSIILFKNSISVHPAAARTRSLACSYELSIGFYSRSKPSITVCAPPHALLTPAHSERAVTRC